MVSVHADGSATIQTGQTAFPVKVVDAAGNGIGGVKVYLYTSSGSWAGEYGNTAENGVVKLNVPKGQFKFRAYYHAHNYWTGVVSVPEAGSATIQTGQISFPVKVVDGAGNGIGGVKVQAYSSSGSWVGSYGNTAADGIANLDLSVGEYKFKADYQRHNFWSNPITLPGASSAVITTGQQDVHIRVEDGDGNPQNAVVYVYTSAGHYTNIWAKTGDSGETDVALAKGSFRIRALSNNRNYWSDTVSVPGTSQVKIITD